VNKLLDPLFSSCGDGTISYRTDVRRTAEGIDVAKGRRTEGYRYQEKAGEYQSKNKEKQGQSSKNQTQNTDELKEEERLQEKSKSKEQKQSKDTRAQTLAAMERGTMLPDYTMVTYQATEAVEIQPMEEMTRAMVAFLNSLDIEPSKARVS
jgi:hypothetical protein